MYLRSTSLGPGNPWCYAFQYWSFTQVTPTPPLPRTGLVLTAWNYAKKHGHLTPYTVQVGDFINWKYTGSRSHIERVTAIGRNGWVTTVAGNTSSGRAGGQRDGDGVYVRQRHTRHPLGIAVIRGAIGRM